MSTIAARVDPEVKAELIKLAGANGLTVSDLLHELVNGYLQDHGKGDKVTPRELVLEPVPGSPGNFRSRPKHLTIASRGVDDLKKELDGLIDGLHERLDDLTNRVENLADGLAELLAVLKPEAKKGEKPGSEKAEEKKPKEKFHECPYCHFKKVPEEAPKCPNCEHELE